MDDRENKFNYIVEQIRNFIIHCIGFKPEDITGDEFNNHFIWKTNNSEFEIIAYYGLKEESDYFDYYLTIDGQRTSGTYSFGTHLTCEDENAIAKIIQPFKETVVNKTTLSVTTNIERSPYSKRYYIIQAFKECHWQDVLFSRGDIQTANKKARHYRNQNNCETRVIEIQENVSYSYEYKVTDKYDRNKEAEDSKSSIELVPFSQQPTQKQLDYIQSITDELGIEFNGKTKEDARLWLSENVPKYKKYLYELNLICEANMQEIYDNYGDQI